MQETLLKYPDMLDSASVGSMLAQSRSARGWDQRDVASRLGLDLSVIAALEDDEFQRLGAPVFVRSFIIRYARLLGLPEQDLVERYKRVAPDQPPPLRVGRPVKTQAKRSDAGVRWFSYSLVFALVLYMGALALDRISGYFDGSDTGDPSGTVANNAGAIALPPAASPASGGNHSAVIDSKALNASSTPAADLSALPPRVIDPPRPVESSRTSVQTMAKAATSPLEALSATKPETLSSATSATPDPEANTPALDGPAAPAAAGQTRLVLSFSEDCWLEVVDADGNRLAYGVIKADTTKVLTGMAPFKVALGNAVATSITFDGKTIDRAVYVPKRGTVSRFVLGKPPADV